MLAGGKRTAMSGYASVQLPDGSVESWGTAADLLGESKVTYLMQEEKRLYYEQIMMNNAASVLESCSLVPGNYQVNSLLKSKANRSE